MIWFSISAKDLEWMLMQRDVDPRDLLLALYLYTVKKHIPGATAGLSKKEKEFLWRIIRKAEEDCDKA